MKDRHQAYNTYTGEIITSTNGRYLKRIIAFRNRIEVKWVGETEARKIAKSWIFCHDGRFTR